MSDHYIITEPSLLTHCRKGREGKGSRKGTGVACDSMHRHLGDAPSRAPIGTRAPSQPATMHDLAPLGWWQR